MSTRTTSATHLRQVCDTFAGAGDARLVELLQGAVRHLHAFVEEVGLTREELLAGLAFLTAAGQRSDDGRRELVLLSDTLGVSMLVEMLNEQPSAGGTEPTILGPFYLEGAPPRSFGASIVDDPATGGEPLTLRGAVGDIDGRPVAGATIEVWQVQPNGLYDVQQHPTKRNLRGVFTALDDGRYEVRTVRPVDYTIPDDGPVGDMLRATARPSWRPAHIHLVVRAPSYKTLVTQVFDQESPWLGNDAVFGVRGSIVAAMDAGECHFDLVLDQAGPPRGRSGYSP